MRKRIAGPAGYGAAGAPARFRWISRTAGSAKRPASWRFGPGAEGRASGGLANLQRKNPARAMPAIQAQRMRGRTFMMTFQKISHPPEKAKEGRRAFRRKLPLAKGRGGW